MNERSPSRQPGDESADSWKPPHPPRKAAAPATGETQVAPRWTDSREAPQWTVPAEWNHPGQAEWYGQLGSDGAPVSTEEIKRRWETTWLSWGHSPAEARELTDFMCDMGFGCLIDGPHRWDDESEAGIDGGGEWEMPTRLGSGYGAGAFGGGGRIRSWRRKFFHGQYHGLWVDTYEQGFGWRGGQIGTSHVSRVYLPRAVPRFSITPHYTPRWRRWIYHRPDFRVAKRLRKLFAFESADPDFAVELLTGELGDWLSDDPRARHTSFRLDHRWLACTQPGEFRADRAREHLAALREIFALLPTRLWDRSDKGPVR